jgi:hypothetical protein
LSACEGALLIIDAAQGVEAQTVANVHLAMKQELAIIPIINKIDLPHANVPQTKAQLEDILAIPGDTAISASAKEGIGIEEILEAIVARIRLLNPPAPPACRLSASILISIPIKAWSPTCASLTANSNPGCRSNCCIPAGALKSRRSAASIPNHMCAKSWRSAKPVI